MQLHCEFTMEAEKPPPHKIMARVQKQYIITVTMVKWQIAYDMFRADRRVDRQFCREIAINIV